MISVRPLPISYRGFHLGVISGPNGFRPAWRASIGDKFTDKSGWRECNVLVDTVEEVVPLAQECIDFQYRVEVAELELGRELLLDELKHVGGPVAPPSEILSALPKYGVHTASYKQRLPKRMRLMESSIRTIVQRRMLRARIHIHRSLVLLIVRYTLDVISEQMPVVMQRMLNDRRLLRPHHPRAT